jgi:hypothetical protein
MTDKPKDIKDSPTPESPYILEAERKDNFLILKELADGQIAKEKFIEEKKTKRKRKPEEPKQKEASRFERYLVKLDYPEGQDPRVERENLENEGVQAFRQSPASFGRGGGAAAKKQNPFPTDYSNKPMEERRFPGVPPSIGTLLDISARKGGVYFLLQNRTLYEKFKLIAGPEVLKHAQPYGYLLGILFLRVDSPHYLERYGYLKRDWLRALNIEMGMEFLTDINLRVVQEDSPDGPLPHDEMRKLSETARRLDNYIEEEES